jgi:putative zinc finger protein
MNHEASIQRHTAEKYLLGELSGSERAAFEQHFFECEECAEEVRLGHQLRENAKSVFDDEAPPAARHARPSKGRAWLSWMRPAAMVPAAACLAIVAIAGYQNVVELPALHARIADLERPVVVQSAMVLPPSSRASAPSIPVSASARFLQLSLAIDGVRPAERYECELRTDSGTAILKIAIPRLDPDANLTLLIPAAKVPAGYYKVVLLGFTGRDAAELEQYRFAVRPE